MIPPFLLFLIDSDKTDVINSPYGLDFINTVRPVQFLWATRDGNAKDGSTRIGFLETRATSGY